MDRKHLLLVAILCLVSLPAEAIERRTGSSVVIESGETLDDTLFARGDSIRVDGTIAGDLIAFGNRVTVPGTVKGDAIIFARTFEVTGKVEGSVYSFTQETELRGEVASSLISFAERVRLAPGSRVAFDATTFTAEARLGGGVGRDATAFSQGVQVDGELGRNLTVFAEHLDVGSQARVAGDLVARVSREDRARIDPAATIGGKTQITKHDRGPSRYRTAGFYLGVLLRIVAAFLTGLFLFWLFPRLFSAPLQTGTDFGHALLIGLIVIVVIPVAAILVALTLVGLPVALFALFLWVAALYTAKILLAAVIGRVILGRTTTLLSDFALALIVGLLLVFFAVNLPYIGGVFHLVAILVGVGLAAVGVRRYRSAPLTA